LRLNLAATRENVPVFSQWRKLKEGFNPKAIVIGTGTVIDNLFKLPEECLNDLEIWLISKFPVYDLPGPLLKIINK
jgi:hypothetical protein